MWSAFNLAWIFSFIFLKKYLHQFDSRDRYPSGTAPNLYFCCVLVQKRSYKKQFRKNITFIISIHKGIPFLLDIGKSCERRFIIWQVAFSFNCSKIKKISLNSKILMPSRGLVSNCRGFANLVTLARNEPKFKRTLSLKVYVNLWNEVSWNYYAKF